MAFLLIGTRALASIGFQTALVPDGAHAPLLVGIWYPSAGRAHPLRIARDTVSVASAGALQGSGLKLIMMSPGQGGGFADQIDTAMALAQAGFVVASPAFANDTLAAGPHVLDIWDRTRQLHIVTDWMLQTWRWHRHLDPGAVGEFGFSAGGLTALVAAGAVPDLRQVPPHCARYPQEFICGFIRQADPTGSPLPIPPRSAWTHDARVRAVVVAAPALGYAFGKSGLAGIKVPVQLWRAGDDDILPQPFYAQAVADALPSPADYHVVPNARHLDFLAPCTAAKAKAAPDLCRSAPDFDRQSFHIKFDQAVVSFFKSRMAMHKS